MADATDADAYVPDVTLPDADSGYVPPGAPPVDATPSAPMDGGADGGAPGFFTRSWRSIQGIPADVWATLATPDTPPPGTPPTVAQGAPVQAPLMSGIAHGVRQAVDQAAGTLARGAETVFGKDTVADLPGYRSSDDIQADIAQRQKDYEADPLNAAGSTSAGVGQAIGTGLALGGPLTRLGGVAAAGLDLTGATAIPGVARLLDYISGGATAAPGSGTVANLATRGASLAAQGAALGAGTGAVTADPSKPILSQIADAAGGGALAGPVVGSAGAVLSYPVRAGLGMLPSMVDPKIAPIADRFINQYGIDLDPSQLTTNPFYRLMGDQAGKMPLSGAGDRIAAARLQWQQAVAGQMGEPAPNGITHDVMDSAATRIGQVYDDVAGRTTIQADPQLYGDLMTIGQDVPRFGLTADQQTPVRAQFQNVLGAFQQGGGTLSGDAFQNLTQTGGPLDRVISSDDPTVAAFGLRIKHALDGAFQRSAAPDDQAALQQAAYQYRVMKTLQPLAEQKGLTGDINPNALLQRVRAQSTRFDSSTGGLAYTGGGALGDLAYGGQQFFGPAPDSGTAARNLIVGGLLGGGLAGVVTHPAQTAMNAAAAGGVLLANRGVQSVLRSPAVGRAMVENTINPPGPFVQRLAPYVLPGLLGER